MTDLTMRVQITDRYGRIRFMMDYGLPRLEIEDLKPVQRLDPTNFLQEYDRQERLRRYTDLLTAQIAHGFTEYMLTKGELK